MIATPTMVAAPLLMPQAQAELGTVAHAQALDTLLTSLSEGRGANVEASRWERSARAMRHVPERGVINRFGEFVFGGFCVGVGVVIGGNALALGTLAAFGDSAARVVFTSVAAAAAVGWIGFCVASAIVHTGATIARVRARARKVTEREVEQVRAAVTQALRADPLVATTSRQALKAWLDTLVKHKAVTSSASCAIEELIAMIPDPPRPDSAS